MYYKYEQVKGIICRRQHGSVAYIYIQPRAAKMANQDCWPRDEVSTAVDSAAILEFVQLCRYKYPQMPSGGDAHRF